MGKKWFLPATKEKREKKIISFFYLDLNYFNFENVLVFFNEKKEKNVEKKSVNSIENRRMKHFRHFRRKKNWVKNVCTVKKYVTRSSFSFLNWRVHKKPTNKINFVPFYEHGFDDEGQQKLLSSVHLCIFFFSFSSKY